MKKSLFVISIVIVLAAVIGCLPLSYAWADEPVVVDVGWYLSQHQNDYVGVAGYSFDSVAATPHALGFADKENQGAIDAQATVFDWGELSELLVWYSLDVLAQRGDLDYQAKISTYVSGVKTPKGEPTVGDLVAHKAGFANVAANLYAQDDEQVKPLIETAKNAPAQLYAPNTVEAYSVYDATLGAYIVEVLSRESYVSFVRREVLTPLGLTSTAVGAALWDDAAVHVARNITMVYDAKGKSVGACRPMTDYYPALSAAGTAEDLSKIARAVLAGNLSRKGLNQQGDKAVRLSQTMSSEAVVALDFAQGKGVVLLTNSPQSGVAAGLLAPEYNFVKAPKGFYRPLGKADRSGAFGWINLMDVRYVNDKSDVVCLAVREDGSLLTAQGVWEAVPTYELAILFAVCGLALLAVAYAAVVLALNLIAAIHRALKPVADYPVRLQQWQTSAAGTILLTVAVAVLAIFAVRLGDFSSGGMLWKSWLVFALSLVGLGHVVALPFVARKQACSRRRIGLYCVTAFALVLVIGALLLVGFFPFV